MPDPAKERSLPAVGSEIIEEGVFNYSDNRNILQVYYPKREGGVPLRADTFRPIRSPLDIVLFENNFRAMVSEAKLVYRDQTVSWKLDIEYDVPGDIEKILSYKILPVDLSLNRIDFKHLRAEKALPFVFTEGTWKGEAISILCTRDFQYSDFFPLAWPFMMMLTPFRRPGYTYSGSQAVTYASQKFQIVGSGQRVFAEVQLGRYRIFDTVAPEDVPSMVALSAIITHTFETLRFLNNYRKGSAKEEDAQGLNTRIEL